MGAIEKRSRTIPLKGNPVRGDGEDSGKYYKCWNCGWICNLDRDALGDSESEANITPTVYTQLDQYGSEVYHCFGSAGSTQAICEAAGGEWTSTRYKPVVNSGCPMCGSPNWRGDY